MAKGEEITFDEQIHMLEERFSDWKKAERERYIEHKMAFA